MKTIFSYLGRGYETGKDSWDFQHLAADYAAGHKIPANDVASMLARQHCYAEFPTRGLRCNGENGKAAWDQIAQAVKAGKLDTLIIANSPATGSRSYTLKTLAERIGMIIESAYAMAPQPSIVVDGIEVSEAELEAIRKLRKTPAKS